jgi:hypothetical protein
MNIFKIVKDDVQGQRSNIIKLTFDLDNFESVHFKECEERSRMVFILSLYGNWRLKYLKLKLIGYVRNLKNRLLTSNMRVKTITLKNWNCLFRCFCAYSSIKLILKSKNWKETYFLGEKYHVFPPLLLSTFGYDSIKIIYAHRMSAGNFTIWPAKGDFDLWPRSKWPTPVCEKRFKIWIIEM